MGKVERQVAKTSESVEGKARSTECILVESKTRSERKHGDTNWNSSDKCMTTNNNIFVYVYLKSTRYKNDVGNII